MKNSFYLFFFAFTLFACAQNNSSSQTTESSPKEDLRKEIEDLEAKLLAVQDASKDTASANAMIQKTELYIEQFPYDSLSPFVLFRAGDVARGKGDYEKAISLWKDVASKYKQKKVAAEALFAIGFTYDAHLDDKYNAANTYRDFLRRYPRHKLKPDVELLLSVISRTPEELIKEFEKNQNG